MYYCQIQTLNIYFLLFFNITFILIGLVTRKHSFNYFVYSLIRDVIKNYIKKMFKIVNLWYYIKYVTYNKNITPTILNMVKQYYEVK